MCHVFNRRLQTISWPLAAIWLTSFLPGTALAQDNSEMFSVALGADTTHAYLFRGIAQETSGSIFQPYAEIGIHLANVDLIVGQWNSLHSGPTGASQRLDLLAERPHTTKMWYESDFYSGVSFDLLNNLEADVTYTSYLSPNNSFGTIKEVALGLTMDDSDFWLDHLFGNFSLSPHILVAVELSGQADGGASEGSYLELGIEPGFELETGTVSISFPTNVGFSLSNYYEDGGHMNDTFGFFEIGVLAALPLTMPSGYGSWEITAGIKVVRLGPYLEALNRSDGSQLVGSGGFGVSF